MRFGYTIGRKMRDPKIVIGNIGNSLYSKRKTNVWKFRIYIYIYTSVCFERAKWRRKKEGEIVSRIFDGEAQRWRNNLKLDGR